MELAQCPQAYHAQFSRGDSGSEPFILLEAVASQDLWIWHAFFGVAVYPEWAVLMKSISQPGSNDVKRIRYKQAHEAARKDVERAFGVLKKNRLSSNPDKEGGSSFSADRNSRLLACASKLAMLQLHGKLITRIHSDVAVFIAWKNVIPALQRQFDYIFASHVNELRKMFEKAQAVSINTDFVDFVRNFNMHCVRGGRRIVSEITTWDVTNKKNSFNAKVSKVVGGYSEEDDMDDATRPDVAFAQNLVSRYQQNPRKLHWVAIKHILKYLRNTRDMFLVYGGKPDTELNVTGFCDAFLAMSIKMITMSQRVMSLSSMESKAAMEACLGLGKFVGALGVLPS
ncbi:retrotransposon protein, putative, ty1-copia subclass [Tanacetum coccineum]